MCDLERRRIVALLPDREIATVRVLLADHPGIRVVSRDRGGGCGEAAAKALPDARARAVVSDLRAARMNTAADLVERSVSES